MKQKPRIVVLDGATTVDADAAPRRETSGAAAEPSWAPLEALGALEVFDRTPAEALDERVRGREVVVINKTVLGPEALRSDAFDDCRLVALLSTGTNAIDLATARSRGITVSNAPAYSTDSVAQHVFALLLGLTNQVAAHAAAVRAGRWSEAVDFTFSVAPLTELSGLTLGIVGFGDIGQRVAAIGHALGMEVAVHSRTRREGPLPVRWVDRDELFATSDVVSLHCPLTDQTRGLIDAERLATMKPGSWLINTGRGGLVVEPDLAAALRSGHLAGAGLDVLGEEPPPADHPLIGCPNCVVTPHNAWATAAARRRLVDLLAGNVRAFLAGQPRNVV